MLFMTNQNISIQIHSDVEKFLKDCNYQTLKIRIWECIDKIATMEFDGGLRVKKLQGISRKIWEARINRASRLVYTYGRQCMIVQDICLDHDDVVRQARRARTTNDYIVLLDRTDIEKIIGDLEQNYCSLDEEEKYNIEIAIEEDLNLPDDFLSSLDNTNYKVLETREQWEKAIIENSADLPYLLTLQEKELVEKTETLLISGSAGTGKTTIGLYRLLNWAKQRLNDEKEGKALYIAYNPVLVQEVKKQFERLIRLDEFKIDSQEIFDIIQFQTIEELCENRINNSNSEFLNDREKLNYNKFEKKYEEKTYHKKGYPAYFIWEEIRGVIKGSHLETESPLLSLEDYKNKGKNRSHVISCEERPEIHNLACWYQKTLSQEKDKKKTKKKDKKKRPIEYYDEIDLTREALKIIRDNKFKQYNLVICDEVQDFAEIQIRLLVEMSKKDSQLIFAGDLNQMISPSGFRWEDLTVNLYNLDFECEKLNNLTLNFRNIQSLANLSHQLLKLRFRFLDERDTLATIEGRNSGELAGLIKHPFSKISNILQEIKAGEGIIVKTEEQKKELQAAFNSKRIFTVEEAKGLEFDTVFLIDFFVEKQDLWDKKLNPKRQLKETEIPELALEFNLLYVAITRARRLLYICETSLSEVWQQPELSNFVKESDFAQVNLNRKNSTPEEWKEQGIVFFNAEKYNQAIECFEKGGDICLNLKNEAIAKLAYENEDYETAGKYYERIEKWEEAAKVWEKITQYEQAGSCWAKCKNWQKAGNCYQRNGNTQKINELKAMQLEEKGEYLEAAKLYEKSNNIQKSVESWIKASKSVENNINKINYLEKAKQLSEDQQKREKIELSIEEVCQNLNSYEVTAFLRLMRYILPV